MTDTHSEYQQFLLSKVRRAESVGFDMDESELGDVLFDWQRLIVRWALRRGRAAMFEGTGLGKTGQQTTWAQKVLEHTNSPVLILAPLAVAAQTVREGAKFGVEVREIKDQSQMWYGVNVCNYERLHRLDPSAYGGVVLDESSCLKAYTGKMKNALCEAFASTRFRLCCTATPAPNDYLELGNQSQFLGVMPSNEMIARWFANDTMAAGSYSLKSHAEQDFWKWMASWAVSLEHPRDIGFECPGFDLPPLNIVRHIVQVDPTEGATDALFRSPSMSSTEMHGEMRLTCSDRAAKAAEIVASGEGPCIVWCNTNYEADELMARIPGAVEVRGAESIEAKEEKLNGFTTGAVQVLVSKPSIAGFGLNWQHCRRMVFVGMSYSYESLYQAIRRSWRYGQTKPVDAHIIMADTETTVADAVQRKQEQHERMKVGMVSAMSVNCVQELRGDVAVSMDDLTGEESGKDWRLLLGDACVRIREIPDNSVRLSVFSPPFATLYIYSDNIADMGNCGSYEEFFTQFRFLIGELCRITLPGRLCCVHCKDLPLYKGRDGAMGLQDFPGETIRAFGECGWVYHSRVTIWKDPVIEMQRTKNHGLLYKNLRSNGAGSRQGMADYVLTFRKWDGAPEGGGWPEPVVHTSEDFPLEQWQQWASPVWSDIRQTDVLNVRAARDPEDERHICPLQLGVIERCIKLWSNPGDLVFTPFAGIGSELYVALKTGRKALGIELKETYARQAARYCRQVEAQTAAGDLFSAIGTTAEEC